MKIIYVWSCAALILSGCASPTVKLEKISAPSTGLVDSYFLQESEITISQVDQSTQQNPVKNTESIANQDFSVVSTPKEMNDFKIGIKKGGWFWAQTILNITKRENTELIKEAGVEVIDYRIDTIKALASIATKAIAMGGFAADKISLPKSINVSVLINASHTKAEKENKKQVDKKAAINDVDAGDGVTINFGPVPPDAQEIGKFSDGSYEGLIYSACRSASVKFRVNDISFSKSVKVADPNYYQYIAFPDKGTISFHSECGVSVQSEKDSGIASTLSILQAIAEQAQTIKDSLGNKNGKK